MSPLERFARVIKAGEVAPAAPLYASDRLYRDPILAGLTAAGVGMGVRGLAGLYNVIRRNTEEAKRPKYPSPTMTAVPYPVVDDVAGHKREKQSSTPYFNDTLKIPGYVPAVAGASILGYYGGNKLMSSLLDSRRQKQREEELADAESDFERALLDSYQHPRQAVKLASDATPGEKLSRQLDVMFDKLAEEPGVWDAIKEKLTMGGNLYAGVAVPAAMLMAGVTYNRARSGSRRNAVEKAVKQRLLRSYASRPSEMLTVPVPVSVDKQPAKIDPVSELDSPDLSAAESGLAASTSMGRRRLIG